MQIDLAKYLKRVDMNISHLFSGTYVWGIIAILILWGISFVVTRKFNPFALACGVDNNFSASLLQLLIFTYITVFSYVAVYVARLHAELNSLPDIPLNLLVLMGLSVSSATASKGIVVSYVEQGKLPDRSDDKSGMTRDKEGNVALTKVQMLIWTFIAAGIYLITVVSFIKDQTFTQSGKGALPDVDGALLVLMGAAQGAYIGGKLVSRSTSAPIIQRILPSPMSMSTATRVTLNGGLFGGSPDGSTVIYRNNATGAQREVLAIPAAQWKDNRIEFDIPAEMKIAGAYTVWVNVNGQESNGYDIVVTA
jgi:hypothetical protein